jgi:hypothetical protein
VLVYYIIIILCACLVTRCADISWLRTSAYLYYMLTLRGIELDYEVVTEIGHRNTLGQPVAGILVL